MQDKASEPGSQPASFAAYESLTKELLTLAAGILAITVTFVDAFIERPVGMDGLLVGASWSVLILSLLGGVLTLMGLAGALYCLEHPDSSRCQGREPVTIYSRNIRMFSLVQVVAFLVGALGIIVVGLRQL